MLAAREHTPQAISGFRLATRDGHIYSSNNVDIFIKRWSGIILDCEWRYGVYKRAFEVEVQNAVAYIDQKHAKYLPGGRMHSRRICSLARRIQDVARAAQVADLVTRSISGHSTERMQHYYSTVRAEVVGWNEERSESELSDP